MTIANKHHLLSLLAYLLPLVTLAQPGRWTWARQGGGTQADAGHSVTTDRAGNVYVAGEYRHRATFGSQTLTQAGLNGFLTKYDSAGTVQWAVSIANSGQCSVADVAADPAGNTYLIGSFSGTASFGTTSFTSTTADSVLPDGFMVKLNAQGIVQWAKHLAGSPFSTSQNVVPAAIVVSAAGDVGICGGFVRSLILDSTQLTAQTTTLTGFALRIQSNGRVLHHAVMQGADVSIINDVHFDSQGNLLMTGFYDSTCILNNSVGQFTVFGLQPPMIIHGFVVGLTPAGRFTFTTRSTGRGGFIIPQALTTDAAGDCYVTGYFSQSCTFAQPPTPILSSALPNGTETFAVKISRFMSRVVWQRQGYGSLTSRGFGIAADTTGSLYLSGNFGGQLTFDSLTTLTAADSINTYLAVFDQTTGAPRWAIAGGNTAWNTPVRLAIDRQSHVYVAGQFTGATQIGSTVLPGNGLRADVFLARCDGARPLALPPTVTMGRGLQVYPNPASVAFNEEVRVLLPLITFHGKAIRVRLLNRLGQVLQEQNILPTRQSLEAVIPISGLAAGLYSVVLEDATHRWSQTISIE